MERFSDSLTDATDIVIESSSTWYGVYRILAKRHHVVLSNLGKTKAIASAKVKTGPNLAILDKQRLFWAYLRRARWG